MMSFDPNTIIAFATCAGVLVAIAQISFLNSTAKKERTLTICNQYDTNPIIHEIALRLRSAHESGEFNKAPHSFRIDVVTLLNYLDSITIGIVQNLYIDAMAFDHTGAIVKRHVEEYLTPECSKAIGISLDNYVELRKMHDRWYPVNSMVKYKSAL